MRRALISVSLLVLAWSLCFPAAGSAGVPSSKIVYSDAYGGSGIYTALPDATAATQIPGTDHALRPVWSSDGTGIAFLARGGGIRWVDADGSNGRAIVAPAGLPGGWPRVGSFAWSPDGSQLVVELLPEDYDPARLFTLTVADGSIAPLLRGARQPDWASDGTIVAVRKGHLITFDADGSNLVEILGTANNSDPAWSPDASRIVFMHPVNKASDIFVVDADGSNPTNLTHSKQVDWSPTWSPDGGTIMWSRSKDVYSFGNLFTMLADGSSVTRLTATDKIDEYEPDWTS